MKALSVAFISLASHSIGQVAYRIASLLLVAIYATALGPEKIGQLEQILALSMLIIPLASFQVYEAFLPIFRRSQRGAISTATLILFLGSMLATLFFLFLAISGRISWLVAASVTAHAVTSMAWQLLRNMLRTIEGYRYLVGAEIAQSIVSLLIGFLLLASGIGISGAFIAISVGNVSACFIALWLGTGHSKLYTFRDASWEVAVEILALSKKMVPNVLLWWGIEFFDRFIIAYYFGDEAVGIYSMGARLAGIVMAVCLLMYQSWQIYAIKNLAIEGGAKTFFSRTLGWYSLASAVLASAFLIGVNPLASILFGSNFSESVNYAVITVPAIYVAAINYFFGIIYYSEKSSVSPWRASVAGLIVSILLNLALVPVLGPPAAAVSLIAAHGTILAIRHKESQHLLRARLGIVNFWAPLLIISAQGLAIYLGVSPLVALSGVLIFPALMHREILIVARSLRSPPADHPRR